MPKRLHIYISKFLLGALILTLMAGCQKDSPEPVVAPTLSQQSPEGMVEWVDLFVELERYASGIRPTASARASAYINLAMYETLVPGMNTYSSLSGQLGELEVVAPERPEDIDWSIALNACNSRTIHHFLFDIPDEQREKIDELQENQLTKYATGATPDIVDYSISWGEYVAQQIILYSQTDEEAEEQITDPQPRSYVPPTGDGFWTYSAEEERALFPYWGSVRTFVIHPDETTSIPPIPFSTSPQSPYYQEMLEVYEANNAAKANQGEELWIAEFWSDDVGGLMMSPPVRQIAIATQLIEQYDMDMAEASVFLLRLGFSLNDAAVAAWKYKYQYMTMRPSEYIREFIDPNFQTNLFRLVFWPNPTFPGYPSGHSTFAGAALGVFLRTFGNETQFTDRSHEGRTEFRGEPRTYSTFREMAEENSYSRIPLGVHVRMDCEEGLSLGLEISFAACNFNLTQG